MQRLLEHDNHEERAAMKNVMKDDVYRPRFDLPLAHERELAFERLRGLCGGR